MSTPAHGSVWINSDVPQLHCHAAESLQKLAVADDASADPCADRQVDKVIMTLARAILPFGQPCHIGIVIQVDRYAEGFA